MTYREQLLEAKRAIVRGALDAAGGNVAHAAAALQVNRTWLHHLIVETGVEHVGRRRGGHRGNWQGIAA